MTLVWSPSYSTQVSDSDAQAYVEAVETADNQQLEVGVAGAINTFVVGCKMDGIWDAIKASCILAGARTLNGALIPLKGTAPTNFNFVSGDYNRQTGLAGDGSAKYLDSNRNNASDPQNNKHLAVYGNVSVASGTLEYFIGTPYNISGWTTLLLDNRSPSGFQAWINGATYPSGMVPLASQTGFFGASRSNPSNVAARIGSTNYTSNTNSQGPFSSSITVFGTGGSSTNARLSFYSIGEALDLALLDVRVSTLMTDIGAAIP